MIQINISTGQQASLGNWPDIEAGIHTLTGRAGGRIEPEGGAPLNSVYQLI